MCSGRTEKCHLILWNRRKQITHNGMSPKLLSVSEKKSNMTESRSNIRKGLDVSSAGYRGVHLILSSSCVLCQRSSSSSSFLSSSTFKSFSSHYLSRSSIPPATRWCGKQWQTIIRAQLLSPRGLGLVAGQKLLLLCWTHSPRGPESKNPERGASGWMDP